MLTARTKPQTDILFVHEAKDIEPTTKIYLAPMGLVSMADLLDRNGFSVQIIHHAIEKAIDRLFDISEFIKSSGAKVVCLDLYWHQQSNSVIKLAEKIKKKVKDVLIVLGGYTASAFDEEILRNFKFIDLVIRGDGEIPVLALMKKYETGGDFKKIPNLTYRSGSQIVRSKKRYVNREADLDMFSFSNFRLMKNFRYYTQRGFTENRINISGNRDPGIFYCNCGRGCSYNCLYCGGSKKAQHTISGRRSVVFRPVQAMMRDLEGIKEYNLDTWYNAFHPIADDSYLLDIFGEIRKRKLKINMIHELSHVPSRRFIREFKKTFGEKSRLDFLVLTGSESLRRKNKRKYFSNSDFFECLDALDEHDIRIDLCFYTGLPFEALPDIIESLEFIEIIKKRYSCISNIYAEPLSLEPCSAMYIDPGSCGIDSHLRSFMDYYHEHEKPVVAGYAAEHFSADEELLISEYLKAAFKCSRSVCLFSSRLIHGSPLPGSPPVKEWRNFCRSCDDFGRCFSSQAFSSPHHARHAGGRTAGKERAVKKRGRHKKKLVQVHYANIYEKGMHFSIGVPFLISHSRTLPEVERTYEFQQVVWNIKHPDLPDPSPEEIVSRILEASPRIVGFSLFPWCYALFLDVIGELKKTKPSIKVIVGGPHATLEEKQLMRKVKGIDFLISGEGEIPFGEFLQADAKRNLAGKNRGFGATRGLYFRRGAGIMGDRGDPPPHNNLDYCGAPLKEGLVTLPPHEGTLHLEWTRGCPNQCSYCAWSRRRKTLRRFSREFIADDINWAIENGVDRIQICDAAINYSDRMLARLCNILVEADPRGKLSYNAFLQYYLVTAGQMEIMQPVRWHDVLTTIETDDDYGLKILNRVPFQKEKFELSIRLIKMLVKPGVEIMTGIPGDTYDKFKSRIDYLLSLDCRISIFPLIAARGTPLWKRRKKLGLVIDEEHHNIIRETPAMPFDEYRKLIEYAYGLKENGGNIELGGYEFVGLGMKEYPSADDHEKQSAGTPFDAGDFRRKVISLARNFKGMDAGKRRTLRVGSWRIAEDPKEIKEANISGMRLAFVKGQNKIGVNVFRAGDIAMPVAKGRHLAFCPCRIDGATATSGSEFEETARFLCMALMKIDAEP